MPPKKSATRAAPLGATTRSPRKRKQPSATPPAAKAPPNPTARAETMRATREALLAAGEELFARDGLDGPSLDAICAHAGKTRGAFYVHFADRDAFLAAVMDRVGAPFLEAVLGGSSPLSLEEVARRFVQSISEGKYPLMREGALRPSQLIDACARSPEVRARYAELIETAVERLAAVIRREQERGDSPGELVAREVATLLIALIVGAQTMLIDLKLPIDVPGLSLTALTILENYRKRGRAGKT
jgi:TetR/AcrR family transcriptional regulator, transcriptional repressor for nem operon